MLSQVRALVAKSHMARPMAKRFVAANSKRFLHATAGRSDAVAETEEEEDGGLDLWKLLSNPLYGLPVGGLAAATAVATDFYVINSETQLLGLWVLFVGTCYHNFGGAIGGMLDETGEAVIKEQHAQENAIIESMQVTADAHKRQVEIADDLAAIREAQTSVMDAIVAAKSSKLQHELRAEIVSKLNNVKATETTATSGIQAGLVESATAQVRDQVAGMKKQALDSAFAALADPNAPAAADPVTEAYNTIFSNFSKNMKDAAGKEIELGAEVQAEIKAELEAIARRDGLDYINVSAPATARV